MARRNCASGSLCTLWYTFMCLRAMIVVGSPTNPPGDGTGQPEKKDSRRISQPVAIPQTSPTVNQAAAGNGMISAIVQSGAGGGHVPFGSTERQYRDATNSQLRGMSSSGTPGTSPEEEAGIFPIGEALGMWCEASSPASPARRRTRPLFTTDRGPRVASAVTATTATGATTAQQASSSWAGQLLPQYIKNYILNKNSFQPTNWETNEAAGAWPVTHPTRPQRPDQSLLPGQKPIPEDRHDSVLEDGQLSYSAIMALGHRTTGNNANSPHHAAGAQYRRPSFHPPYPQEVSGEDDGKGLDDTPDEELDQVDEEVAHLHGARDDTGTPVLVEVAEAEVEEKFHKENFRVEDDDGGEAQGNQSSDDDPYDENNVGMKSSAPTGLPFSDGSTKPESIIRNRQKNLMKTVRGDHLIRLNHDDEEKVEQMTKLFKDATNLMIGGGPDSPVPTQDTMRDALKLWVKAARMGHILSMRSVGVSHYYGHGTPRDYQQAARWFRKCADLGDNTARFYLAILSYTGEGVDQSYVEAGRLWRECAENGSGEAAFFVGGLYFYEHLDDRPLSERSPDASYSGDPIPGPVEEMPKVANPSIAHPDVASILYWFQQAAELGYGWAALQLSYLHEEGLVQWGFAQNRALALDNLQSAVRMGIPKAMHTLGEWYVEGIRVPRNAARALELFREAASLGFGPSLDKLASAYYSGQVPGVPHDVGEAMRLWERAYRKGYGSAAFSLGCLHYYCDSKLPKEDRDLKECVRWWKRSAHRGYQKAWIGLGNCAMNGEGMEKDRWLAVKYWDRGKTGPSEMGYQMLEFLADSDDEEKITAHKQKEKRRRRHKDRRRRKKETDEAEIRKRQAALAQNSDEVVKTGAATEDGGAERNVQQFRPAPPAEVYDPNHDHDLDSDILRTQDHNTADDSSWVGDRAFLVAAPALTESTEGGVFDGRMESDLRSSDIGSNIVI